MKPKAVTIKANGVVREVPAQSTVADFLETCGLKASQVVVERNGNILERSVLGEAMLSENDELEVILPVAGG